MERILLIDDDHELCDMLEEYLQGEGFGVDAVHDGRQGLVEARSGRHGLIILDVMLPGMDGFEVLRELRKHDATPVLMLTARGEDVDTIVGLELGADDYLPKPFNPRLLSARIRAILRRAGEESEEQSEILRVGDVSLDRGSRKVHVDGRAVVLTGAEFNVLATLLSEAGVVVDKERLSREALGRRLQPFDRSIDMHISNLRRKLGPRPDGASRIETLRGAGYQYLKP